MAINLNYHYEFISYCFWYCRILSCCKSCLEFVDHKEKLHWTILADYLHEYIQESILDDLHADGKERKLLGNIINKRELCTLRMSDNSLNLPALRSQWEGI